MISSVSRRVIVSKCHRAVASTTVATPSLRKYGSFSTAVRSNDEEHEPSIPDPFNFHPLKSGTPSPWAVYDNWGEGLGDNLEPFNPALEAKLTGEAVQIPFSDSDPQGALPVPEILEAYDELLQSKSAVHFGYPYNLNFDYSELAPFMQYSINNLGDPFVPSNYGVHSRQFEVAVIAFFAKLWHLQDYWGYVTTSGTEGNLHGILLARECFPDGVLYTSQETHYSIFKAARYYRMPSQAIPTLPQGEMDYDALEAAIKQNIDKPVILNVNIGTTVKGATDDLDRIVGILNKLKIPRDRFYIHCDGALFALMMPFIQDASEISFESQPIDSMAVSGHKMLGCPMPCGVTLSRLHHVKRLEEHIEYLNSVDTTIMGSRNGQAALYLWYSLRQKGLIGLQRDVEHCMETARYLRDTLEAQGWACRLNKLSTTVCLERPLDDKLVKRWQLACQEDIAHVVVMPNVTRAKIDRFVAELATCREKYGQIAPVRPDSPLTQLVFPW